jgi:hypothetical protein
MRKSLLTLLWVGFSAFAESALACPTTYLPTDNLLWESARDSGAPRRWVQHYVTGCDPTRQLAQELLKPIFGTGVGGAQSATSTLSYHGKFSGDQTNREEAARNGGVLQTSGGGGHLFGFRLVSRVNVTGGTGSPTGAIPKILYTGLGVDPYTAATRNIALWIEYQCSVVGQSYSAILGVPNVSEGQVCPATVTPNIFDRVKLQLKGPYRNFFTLKCVKDDGTDCETPNTWIRTLTITLTPNVGSFQHLMSGGYLQ